MEYRTLPHGGEKISMIGLGSGSLTGSEQEMTDVLNAAIQNGINYFDMAPSVQAPFFAYAKAFDGRRDQIITQMHFGAVYKDEKYGWTRDLDEIKGQLTWQLKLLGTDYTDVGFIHCVDDLDDLNKVMNGGLWEYMKSLKADGTIRHYKRHERIVFMPFVSILELIINKSYLPVAKGNPKQQQGDHHRQIPQQPSPGAALHPAFNPRDSSR